MTAKFVARKPRMYDLRGLTTGELPSNQFDLWSSQVKDEVYAAMEALIKRTGIKELEITQAICYQNKDKPGPIWEVLVTVMEKLGPDDILVIHE